MKPKPGFNLRTVCGESIIVAEGRENIDFSKVISMNESAAFLWKAVEDKEFSTEELVRLLMKEYGIDGCTATKDAAEIAERWLEAGITEK